LPFYKLNVKIKAEYPTEEINMKYEKLFTPIKIGNVEIKNRICMAPMLMGFGQIDGKATDQLMDYYEERAKGGTGLIFTEITRVNDRTGGSAFKQLGMSHDYQIEKMKEEQNTVDAQNVLNNVVPECEQPQEPNLEGAV
jgi:2,4-dienoyl-CoA reductase-like NADH-dependent reductase (Old Yellow Enzyme family)